MSDYKNPLWPNGLQKDEEGYTVFYPMGANKVDITTITWPDGDKLVSPFVYQNGKLVGFVDTKALTVSGSAATTMNYSHIEADFSSIVEGKLTVNAPNAVVKKIKWNVTIGSGDNSELGDTREIKTKYDIWANAEVENEDGTIEIKNLYIPDASGWLDDFSSDMNYNADPFRAKRSLTRNVIDNKVYFTDTEELDLENLGSPDAMFQTSKIVNGSNLFSRTQPSPFNFEVSYNSMCPKMIFKSNLDNLKYGRYMFDVFQHDCYQEGSLDFVSNLPNLIDGSQMFCENILEKFEQKDGRPVNLDNLENGYCMFSVSGAYKYFGSIDMPKLKNGNGMFSNWNLSSFDMIVDKIIEEWSGNLDSLENGVCMFGGGSGWGYDGCKILRFVSNLPKLKLGSHMSPCIFEFRGSLPSLENGYNMFKAYPCDFYEEYTTQLDGLSIQYIVNSIPDRTGLINTDGKPDYEWVNEEMNYDNNTKMGYIDIGCGCADTESDKQLYAEEGGFSSFQDILNQFSAKNWVVRFTFNGRPTQTYNMRRTTEEASTQFWAKLEEVFIPTEEETNNKRLRNRKPHYDYTSQDETKYYTIHTYSISNGDNEGYIQFNSLDEAIEYFNIKPVEIN